MGGLFYFILYPILPFVSTNKPETNSSQKTEKAISVPPFVLQHSSSTDWLFATATTTSAVNCNNSKMPIALQLALKARSNISPNPVARLYRAVVK